MMATKSHHGSIEREGTHTLAEPSRTLTPTETRVLAALQQGLSNIELAERFIVSVKTIEAHIAHIRAKLNARSRTHLVAMHAAASVACPHCGGQLVFVPLAAREAVDG